MGKQTAVTWRDLRIGQFTFWDLFLYERQDPYIGSAYAWLKRAGTARQDFHDLSEPERDELSRIQAVHAKMWRTLFNRPAVRVEYVTPYNAKYLGHCYQLFIPRFGIPVDWSERKFTDVKFGKPYGVAQRGKRIPKHLLMEIQNEMFARLPNP